MKITPTRAALEKVKRENARRAREMKGRATKGKESEKGRRKRKRIMIIEKNGRKRGQ